MVDGCGLQGHPQRQQYCFCWYQRSSGGFKEYITSIGFPCNAIPGNALWTKTIAYHCNSLNSLLHSLERMIKNPPQFSLADLSLRFSISCLWNLDFKEEGIMNMFADYLKEDSIE